MVTHFPQLCLLQQTAVEDIFNRVSIEGGTNTIGENLDKLRFADIIILLGNLALTINIWQQRAKTAFTIIMTPNDNHISSS